MIMGRFCPPPDWAARTKKFSVSGGLCYWTQAAGEVGASDLRHRLAANAFHLITLNFDDVLGWFPLNVFAVNLS